ncbi:MAG: hypothetical protein QM710_05925 [Flavobacterium sp.]
MKVSQNLPFSNSDYYPVLTYTSFADYLTYKEYRSAFHLTKVTDMNENTLIDFTYFNNFNETTTLSRGMTENFPVPNGAVRTIWQSIAFSPVTMICPKGGEGSIMKAEPLMTHFSTSINVDAKKLKDITVHGVAKIHFNFEQGREDSCYGANNKGCKLTDITIYNWRQNTEPEELVRKYEFRYKYHELFQTRMFLSEIDVLDKNLVKDHDYKFSYEHDEITNPNSLSGVIGKDYWGYCNLTSKCDANTPREVSPEFCTSEVLQKIKLPTGGSEVFQYESNSYSYTGADALVDFDENTDNWETTDFQEFNMYSNVTQSFENLGYFDNETILVFNSVIDDNEGQNGFLHVFKYDPSNLSTPINAPNGVYVHGELP